jgi:hypothetical protein
LGRIVAVTAVWSGQKFAWQFWSRKPTMAWLRQGGVPGALSWK